MGAAEQDMQGTPAMGVPPGIAAAPTPAQSFEASLCPPSSEPCALCSSSQWILGGSSQGKSLCAPGATLGMLESLPSRRTSWAPQEVSSSKRSRAGGSCWLGGLYPAAHGMVHSQTFTLLSF